MTDLFPQPESMLPPASPPAGALPRTSAANDHGLTHVGFHTLLLEVWDRLARGEAVADSTNHLTTQMIMVADAICESLAKITDVHDNRFSRQRFFNVFWTLQRGLAAPKPPIAGATYLEVGCGSIHPLGLGLLMCMLGAKRGIGIDLDPVQDTARAARAMARLIDVMLQDPVQLVGDYPITREQIVSNLHGIDKAALRRGDPAGIGSRLSYHHESVAKMSFGDGSVDVVVSTSFLEHVDDVDAALAEIARVTSIGGFGVHAIDGVDHRSYGDSSCGLYDFLSQPGPGMVNGSNRIRPLEFPAYFERHGFAVQQVIPRGIVPLTPQEIARFSPPWSTMPREVLEATMATIVVRRT